MKGFDIQHGLQVFGEGAESCVFRELKDVALTENVQSNEQCN